VRSFAGVTEEPAGFDALHELLELQAYRLAYWRVASDDINYRRFFDINDLSALHAEDEAVFDATHRLVLELVAAGKLDGLRVDHADGLYDVEGYCRRLQQRVAAARGLGEADHPLPIYLLVEKITTAFEHLPPGWPVHGETGYHFANVVNRMLVNPATKGRMDRLYRSFIGQSLSWEQVAYECKLRVLQQSLASELNVVSNQLMRIAQSDRRMRDFTFNSLRQALAEVIACFPVYRTYVTDTVTAADRRYIEWAIAAARRHRSVTETQVFDFARAALLLELPVLTESARRRMREFAMKFQQVTAPIAAKGVEDTAFYRFNRLVSLNEVGGEPDRYAVTVNAFHDDAQYRARHWPHEMLATSTHDTKRSEDVRARINVLSEIPAVWRAALQRWSRLNRARKREFEGAPAPTRNDEYLFYQTLIGTWPLEELDEASRATYCDRLEHYMVKAAREAKLYTSWASPSPEYEEALVQFVRSAVNAGQGNVFLSDFLGLHGLVVRFGLLNSLSQTLCKLTAPGVPDIYQGNEIWDFSLVDPDNRRPVDYEKRRGMLAQLAEDCTHVSPQAVRSLLDSLHDGRCKLLVTWKTLQFRRAHEELFRSGEYVKLRVSGTYAAHVCAYGRRREGRLAIVVAPRLYLRLLGERHAFPLGTEVWADTRIELPGSCGSSGSFRNVFDHSDVQIARSGESSSGLLAGEVLAHFPVALLSGTAGSA
jgi:(1->4)-alpha-D-glucan 1-alpha-D-glucosylmutase